MFHGKANTRKLNEKAVDGSSRVRERSDSQAQNSPNQEGPVTRSVVRAAKAGILQVTSSYHALFCLCKS